MNRLVDLPAAERLAYDQLQSSGFLERGLAELTLPQTNVAFAPDGSAIPYQLYGDHKEAQQLVFEVAPYSTRITDDSMRVRVAAQQTAVGSEVCIVSLQATGPEPEIRTDARQNDQIKQGSLKPLSERVLAVIEAVKPRDDQQVSLYGFSLGADISVETAYQNVLSENHGITQISRLTAIECARHQRAGYFGILAALKTAQAFAASGEDLYMNVLSSDSVALREARGIDLLDDKAEKHHTKQVNSGVAKYMLADLVGNYALGVGLGRDDKTLEQLNIMTALPHDSIYKADIAPITVIGRASRSTICPPEFLDQIVESPKYGQFEVVGDHSIADNLYESAAFMVLATRDLPLDPLEIPLTN